VNSGNSICIYVCFADKSVSEDAERTADPRRMSCLHAVDVHNRLRDTVARVDLVSLLCSSSTRFIDVAHTAEMLVQFLSVLRPITRQNSLALCTMRYDTSCYFNVRSKADVSQLNLPHGTDN